MCVCVYRRCVTLEPSLRRASSGAERSCAASAWSGQPETPRGSLRFALPGCTDGAQSHPRMDNVTLTVSCVLSDSLRVSAWTIWRGGLHPAGRAPPHSCCASSFDLVIQSDGFLFCLVVCLFVCFTQTLSSLPAALCELLKSLHAHSLKSDEVLLLKDSRRLAEHRDVQVAAGAACREVICWVSRMRKAEMSWGKWGERRQEVRKRQLGC